MLPEWRIDNRVTKLGTQGITKTTARERAKEALARLKATFGCVAWPWRCCSGSDTNRSPCEKTKAL